MNSSTLCLMTVIWSDWRYTDYIMKIVLASNNKNKIKELRELIADFGGPISELDVITLRESGYVGSPDECGVTFAENAEIKALAAVGETHIGIGDDSGLEVDALGGAPGVYSARYAGEDADDDKNNRKLLVELASFDCDARKGRFVCAMCCAFPDGERITSFGSVEGRILDKPQGDGGFGYDCLFYVDKYNKTMAEMTMEEKNEISHRGIAMRELIKKINKKLGQNNDK